MRIKDGQAGAEIEVTPAMIAEASQVLEDSFDAAPSRARIVAEFLFESLGFKLPQGVGDGQDLNR